MRRLPAILCATLPLLGLCGVFQFDASRDGCVAATGGVVTAWHSANGNATAVLCHEPVNGWSAPSPAQDAISFDSPDGSVSPLSFDETMTAAVARVFAVADCTRFSDNATLIDAPCPIRLAPSPFAETPASLVTSNALGSLSISVDASATNILASGLHLVEAEFPAQIMLCDLSIGGSPATPAWQRGWCGSVREIILTDGAESENECAAIRSYLAKKWGLAPCPSGVENENAILRALGIRTGMVYGSLLIMR